MNQRVPVYFTGCVPDNSILLNVEMKLVLTKPASSTMIHLIIHEAQYWCYGGNAFAMFLVHIPHVSAQSLVSPAL